MDSAFYPDVHDPPDIMTIVIEETVIRFLLTVEETNRWWGYDKGTLRHGYRQHVQALARKTGTKNCRVEVVGAEGAVLWVHRGYRTTEFR